MHVNIGRTVNKPLPMSRKIGPKSNGACNSLRDSFRFLSYGLSGLVCINFGFALSKSNCLGSRFRRELNRRKQVVVC